MRFAFSFNRSIHFDRNLRSLTAILVSIWLSAGTVFALPELPPQSPLAENIVSTEGVLQSANETSETFEIFSFFGNHSSPEQQSVSFVELSAESVELRVASVMRRLYPASRVNSTKECSLTSNPLSAAEFNSSGLIIQGSTHELPVVGITISNDFFPNAFALPGVPETNTPPRIELSKGLLSQIQSESELAFVLAHEMAHLRHDHFSPNVPDLLFTPAQLEHISLVHQSWELIADSEARSLLITAGFNPESARYVLAKLAEFENRDQSSHRHPEVADRLAALINSPQN